MPGGGWVRRRGDTGLGKSLVAALASTGDHESVRELLRPAIDCWQRRDLDGAEAVLRLALLSPDVSVRAVVQLLLADVLRVRGDLEDGLLMMRLAVEGGHREIAPLAACVLGNWLEEYGALESARRCYQQAVDSGHRVHGVRGRAHLAELLYFEGQSRLAEVLLNEAISCDAVEWSGQAAGLLGDIRFAEGDVDGAYEAFRAAAVRDALDPADRAVVMLAVLIDVGCGGDRARADYADLERAGVSPERAAFIGATLARWRCVGQGVDDAMGAVDPDWAEYYAAATRFQRSR
jgi:predicted negative regulator of RcsB-dependent stress response